MGSDRPDLREGLHRTARNPVVASEALALLGLGGSRGGDDYPVPAYDDLTGVALPKLVRMRTARRVGLAVSLMLLIGGGLVSFVILPLSNLILVGMAAFLLGLFCTVVSILMLRNAAREIAFVTGLARSVAPER